MQAWPLTGRAQELGVSSDVLRGDGPYAGVVIAGSAGVGKTRLAREAMVAAAQRCWTVHWVAGTVAAQSVPLGAFAQWADRLEGNPLHLVGSVIAAVTASPDGNPVLMVVDDARLLDDLSAFVVQQLVLRRAATVIATIRTGDPVSDAVAALWKDGHLRRLDLQPLSRGESDALLESVLGGPVSTACAERMWGLSRGNDLFLHQLVSQEMHAGRLVNSDQRWQWEGTMEVRSPRPSSCRCAPSKAIFTGPAHAWVQPPGSNSPSSSGNSRPRAILPITEPRLGPEGGPVASPGSCRRTAAERTRTR
jgi:hypothetical protein